MLIDAHCHLQFSAFDKDLDETIQRAFKNNIGIINAGTDKESSKKAVELAEKYPQGLWATVGLHPTETEVFDYEFYKNLAKNEKVVAIGECGLDFYFRTSDVKNINSGTSEVRILKNLQKEIFLKQIQLANEIKKPLMIHCRDAFADLIDILTINCQLLITNRPGVIHFFTGSLDDAKKLLDMGFYFTFGGLITFNRSFDEIIKFIPLERILLETDAPFVVPEPYRGKRNEPSYIIETVKKMAEIKDVSFNKIAEQTTKNAKIVFKFGM